MNIKVIGSGCENCDKTNAVVKECLEELGMDYGNRESDRPG